jgi:AbrB family looped-hinge helix DNA binding protein
VLAAIDGAGLAHIAAHGTFRADSPMFSSLRLDDGPMTVHDLERLRRAPFRLILPSCESGLLVPASADELLGLASALLPLGRLVLHRPGRLVLRSTCNTRYSLEAAVVLNSKGQVTIPAHLRAKFGLREGDEVEVVEVGGVLQIVRAEGAETRGHRLVRRLRNTATSPDVEGMSTDEIMDLLRAE